MFLHQRFIPGLAIASYIVGDESSKLAAVVDPTRDVDELIRVANGEGLRIAHILETHVHADFVSGAVELKARLKGEPTIHCSGEGGKEWTPAYADRVIRDRGEIVLGNTKLVAHHTPGHTPEHLTWAVFDESRSKEVPWLLLTGDFLFIGDVGRPDLLGDAQLQALAGQLHQSAFERLSAFPDFVEIFPGHGAGSLCGKAIGARRSSTLGFERRFNCSLKPSPREQWIKNLLNAMPPAPPYFARMKQINVKGPSVLGEDAPALRALTSQEARQLASKGAFLLDVRPIEIFAAGHLPGAINIPLASGFSNWSGWIVPPECDVILLAGDPSDIPQATVQLHRVGFDRITGAAAISPAGDAHGLHTLQLLTPAELKRSLNEDATDRPIVLDVRTDSEWNAGHIEGAMHIHAGFILHRLEEIPRDRKIAVICGTGYRGSIVASLLQKEGFVNVANVIGGMNAWAAAG